MALETAKICEEKGEKRVGHPVEPFDEADCSGFKRPLGYGQFARLMRCKALKTIWFPAPSRLLCKQICSYHCNPVYESMT